MMRQESCPKSSETHESVFLGCSVFRDKENPCEYMRHL